MYEYKTNDIIDNRYKVIEEIGGGGFGKVVSVLDQHNGETIALKYCWSESSEDLLRFKREVRIMENIVHENVVKVLNSHVDHNPPFFTMPLAIHSVTKIIPDLQGDTGKVIQVFEAICKGINAVHYSGHTHRDIKPDNALVYEGSHIVVSDLGLAKFDDRDSTVLTRASIYIGTYDYMPPEQMVYGGTRNLDHRGDVYQLGKTLYHLLTGDRPIVLNPNAVPVPIWYVIKRATRENPDQRYQSVDLLLDALNDAVRAIDPEIDSFGSFEELINITEEKLKSNTYDPNDILRLLQLLFSIDNHDEYIKLFHRIPNRILQAYASIMVSEFEPVLEKYKVAIDEVVGSYTFEFAEKVAQKMEIIFQNTNSPEIKTDALICVLMAGRRLNRWVAMGTFDRLLKTVNEETVAYSVAEGLRDNMYDYKRLYDRIPKSELHPAIQLVWEACKKREDEVSIED
ncbi:Serine/threonine protein kinase [Psychrobacillus sp. OK028]|uniref:serine/threonine protein kinase n=1 Tax=Psychrobacillus sp. OK028 TaxID=1884359 RepID=UPI0008915AE4|nr:serine/threonine-protein kinase [Psychrobacillus sp. OK028]SDO02724.1 Serine/threonine protein kinase [Psychrobacillus sp. OK028]